MTKRTATLTGALLLLACDDGGSTSESYPPSFSCSLGALTGTWRLTYKEMNGDCGDIPDETVNYSTSPGGSSTGCKSDVADLSADKCKLDFNFTCPTTDNKGTQQWSGVTRQTSETTTDSDTTVQLKHSTLGQCRSTYRVSGKKL